VSHTVPTVLDTPGHQAYSLGYKACSFGVVRHYLPKVFRERFSHDPLEAGGDMDRMHALPDLTAAEIMSSPGVVCRREARLEELAELMSKFQISGMPVVDRDSRVVGVISERDIAATLGSPLVRLAINHPLQHRPFLRKPHPLPVGARRARDIMTSPAIVARPETPMHTLASIMVKKRINRIPIVDRARLVGIVTRKDVLSAIAGQKRFSTDESSEPVVVGSAGMRPHTFEEGL
jgi:CBS domain-containing protein